MIWNRKRERCNQPSKALLSTTLFLTFTLIASCAGGPRSVDGGSLISKFRKAKVETKEVTTKSQPKAVEPQQLTTKISPPSQAKSETLEKNQSANWQAGGVAKMTGADSAASPNLQWSNGRVSFSFENAPIAVVIEGVLHGGLGLGYTIDPEVSGSVTLRTSRPLARDDVIASLDRALWVEGVVLMQNPDGSYLVTTAAKAPSVAPPPRNASAVIRGGGTIIVPLQYVSVENISSILEGLGKKDAVAHIDNDRQLIILRGNQTTLQNTVETINLFDVDWLRSASFRFYEIRWTDPDTLIAELTALMGGQQGPIGRQVDFVSLPRLNGLVVICKRPERQTEISEWISRLDRPARGGNEKRLFHRWIINQDAEVVAETLNKLFSNVAQNQSFSQRNNERNQNQSATPDSVNSIQTASPTQNRAAANRSATSNQQPPAGSSTQGSHRQPNIANDSNNSVPSITADAATNALLIYATDDEYRQIDEVINRLDLTPDQVMIEATIAEVVLNDQLKYGVQWFIDQNNGHSVTFSSGTDNSTPSAFPGFSYRFVGTDARAVLNALSQVTDVSVVSTPQIMTLDNKTATLQIGDQVPIITQSAQGTSTADARVVNSVQYRDTGILLTVTPRIGSGNSVLIDASQEVSEVAATSSSGIDSPTIQQRRFQTSVLIQNGSTIALGGLIRTRRSVGDTRVPYIGAIPIVGTLFRTRDNSVRTTELIVFLTPTIVRSNEDANEVTAILRARLNRIRALEGVN